MIYDSAMNELKIAILYHQVKPGTDCPDGIAAAWVADRYFRGIGFVTDLIGCVYQSEPPDMSGYDRIEIVDFSFPREVIDRWAEFAKVTLLDHHKTAQEHLGDISQFSKHVEIKFNMQESGATLAWQHYFHSDPPAFLRYVRDRDLWNFDLPKSEEIHEAVSNTRYSLKRIADNFDLDPRPIIFKLFDIFWGLTEQELIAKLSPEGERLLAPKRAAIAAAADRHRREKLPEPRPIEDEIPIVRCAADGSEDRLVSDICSRLYTTIEGALFVGCITSDGKYSLRSNKKGNNFDVSSIAKSYGGGGHQNAAGFDPRGES